MKHFQGEVMFLSPFWKGSRKSCFAWILDHAQYPQTAIHSMVSNDSGSGQRRPFHCADAQTDLGFPHPHKLEDTFSHGAAKIYDTKQVMTQMNWDYKQI